MVGTVQYETDRARFLGRGRSIREPISIEERRPLSNTAGTVLDPVFSLRRRLVLAPGATARVHLATVVAGSREEALALAGQVPGRLDVRPRVEPRLDAGAGPAAASRDLRRRGAPLPAAGDSDPLFGRRPARSGRDDPAQPEGSVGLLESRNLRRLAHRAGPHRPGRGPGDRAPAPACLRVLADEGSRGRPRDRERATRLVFSGALRRDRFARPRRESSARRHPGASDRAHLRAARKGALGARRGPRSPRPRASSCSRARERSRSRSCASFSGLPPRGPRGRSRPGRREANLPPPRIPLEFFNGMGGFSEAEGEYVTLLGERQWTPAPWINVLANASLGCLVSESGSGYTWAINARENQLTPWSNDPVSDPPGEALYLRDEETGEIWSPTPLPIRGDGFYVVRHGQGYSRFEYEVRGIATDLTVLVAPEDPVKISRLWVENRSATTRTLTVTAYAEWVLGPQRAKSAPFVVTELDSETGALFARNAWNEEHAGRVAFADIGGGQTAWTADRCEFLGRNGGLGGSVGPGARSDPLAPHGSRPGSLRRAPDPVPPGSRAAPGSRLPARPGRRHRRGATARRPSPIGGPRSRAGGRAPRVGGHPHGTSGANSRPVDGPDAQPVASLSDARLPHAGARRPSTRPEAPGASATSCRMRWPSRSRGGS